MEITGEKVKALREELGGLSQEELARLLGVSAATVNRWERGHFAPSRLAQEKIEGLLKKAKARPKRKGEAEEPLPAEARA